MKILMLYPKFTQESFWNLNRSARVFFRRSGTMPPLGLLTIASYFPKDFELRLVDRNVSEEMDADWEWADVVFLSLMCAQEADYHACVAKARMHCKPIAVGGPFTHAKPEVAVADADWVCFGEAETIMDQFISDLQADRRGQQYQGSNSTDMELVRMPRFDLLQRINGYHAMAIQFSRGCPFRCEFCDIIEIYGRVPRTKTSAQVLAELSALKRLGYKGLIFLVDDNFIGNKKNAKILLEHLAAWNQDNGSPYLFYTEASINLADDKPLLEAMSKANFLFVFIGIETPDPKLLKTTLKVQNIPGNPLEKLQKIRQHGIHIIAGFIVGFDGEELGIFDAQRSFIQASGIGVAMIGLLQAIPHTQLSRRLEQEGRLLKNQDVHGISTMEGINFIPKGQITKREYLRRYGDLVKDIYEPKAFFERILPALLSLSKKASLRGFYETRRQYTLFTVRLMYHWGLKTQGVRRYFWKTLFRLLWNNPGALDAFYFDCFLFHHLNRHADYVRHELLHYLSSPPPYDVMDQVIPPSEAPYYVESSP
jgi:radical SAM superfamily enzyme YgiQ (UPF0313 family)